MRFETIIKSLLIGGFFASTLWLVLGMPIIFNSPDESANYLFSNEVIYDQDLALDEEANVELSGIIHPRSMIAIGDKIVPRSFLGLPVVAGIFGILFGPSTILYLTPILAVLTILAWRSSVFMLFNDKRLADVSAFLLMIHPAFWFYSGR